MLTCVSGFWPVINKHGNKFIQWFKTSLKINCPYIFFSNKQGIELIKQYRNGLPTYYIECNIEDFYTYKYKDKIRIHPQHCPSIELNLIWHEKIFLLEKAKIINPFKSDFFCWIDAGVCIYRTVAPPSTYFPNQNKLRQLPKDKFIYSTSTNKFQPHLVTNKTYYHYIAGTAYIMHIDIITQFMNVYKAYLDKIFYDEILCHSNIWTDQVVLTHIFKEHPYKFFKLGDGYGNLIINLF